jgi:ABC-type phosphate/phosphonate transport system substrate-binding protein
MKRWKIGLPMYRDCAPADHGQLLGDILAGLRKAGWMGAVDLVDDPGELGAFWRSADLLLGQACGYPLMTSLAGRVQLLGTPCYDFPGCVGYRYCSYIMVAEGAGVRTLEDLRGVRAAFNQPHSQSGMNALRHAIAPLARHGRFFSSVLESGSHRASLQMVANGHADVAAVDCVTHGYLALHAPHVLDGLRILCRTEHTAGLPLIASSKLDEATVTLLRKVLLQVFSPDAADTPAARLRLTGFVATQFPDYGRILETRRLAHERLYPDLA